MTTKAKESRQIQKARRKIQQQIEAADKKINPDTLAAMRTLIKRQLARHETERIPLKMRQITPFDENQHPAPTESRFVTRLLKQLSKESIPEQKDSLEGRVAPLEEDES